MIVALYVIPDCPSCEAVARLVRKKARVDPSLFLVGFSVSDQAAADKLLEEYPQMACSTCLYGVRLPFMTVDDELVGAHDDIVRWLGS